MKHLQLFEEWHSEKSIEELEDELQKEVDWVNKYSDYIDNGRFPEDDYNDEAEFYEDLKRTEDHIEELNKMIRDMKANEGIFNYSPIFNRGMMDFTRPMASSAARSRSRWWNRRKQETPKKKVEPRPYYGVQEEEEEEAPASKQAYRKSVLSKTNKSKDDEYWSDENVAKRSERNKKYARNRKTEK